MMQQSEIWQAIDRLAASRGLSPSALARQAGLDPTSFNPSKRQTREGRPRWPSTESIARICAATGISFPDFAVLSSPEASDTPLFHFRLLDRRDLESSAPDALFDQDGRPAGSRWDESGFPRMDDPDLYALELNDDSLAPVWRQGDVLFLSPAAPLRPGDRVLLCPAEEKDGNPAPRWHFGEIRHLSRDLTGLAPLDTGTDGAVSLFPSPAWIHRIIWSCQ